MLKSVLVISIGACLGALLRWQLSLKLNGLFQDLPPGTLIANLLGSYVIGIAIAVFISNPNISPEWKLLIITGFCGSLTTFSTFSAELMTLLQQGRYQWACTNVLAHVMGSLLMTGLGLFSVHLLRKVSA